MILNRKLMCLVAAALAASGMTAQEIDTDLNPPVMKVNGEVIYAAEVSLILRSMADQARREGSPTPPEELLGVATQRVIEQKLLAQEARRFGLAPDQDNVSRMMATAARQVGGREKLASSLAAGGSNLEQLESFYRELELGRVFISRQIRPTIQVDDEEIETFYHDNPEAFTIQEQVRVRDILVALDENAGEEAERAARERAENARRRALAGENFAALARELSDDPNVEQGGERGFVTRSQVHPEIADIVFELAPGEISPPVRTPSGYHVILVEDRRPAGLVPLEEARERARSIVVNHKTAEVVGELLKTLYDSATIEDIPPSSPNEPPSSESSETP